MRGVNIEKYTERLKEKVKGEIRKPEWSRFVKTSCGSERPPDSEDWWFERAGAILRKLYKKPMGVSRLRGEFSRRKRRGVRPERRRKAGGKIIRTILKQLEEKDLVKKEEGRMLTKRGKEFIRKTMEEVKYGF